MARLGGDQLVDGRQLSCQDLRHCFSADRAPFLEDAIVHTAFQLHEHRRVNIAIIVTQSQLVAVLGGVDIGLVGLKAVRIEINAMDGICAAGFAYAEIVQLQITAYEIPHPTRDRLVHEIFQLEALKLEAMVLSHGVKSYGVIR